MARKECCNKRAAGLAGGLVFGASVAFASLIQSFGWSSSWIHLPIEDLSFLPSEGLVGALSQSLGHLVYGFVCGFLALYAGFWLYERFT